MAKDPYLVLHGAAIPVHKASSTKEPIKQNDRVISNCHSIIIRNVGTSVMFVNGEPYRQGEAYTFTPPVLNVIDTTVYDVKFDSTGTNECWVTRSIINFCFE